MYNLQTRVIIKGHELSDINNITLLECKINVGYTAKNIRLFKNILDKTR